jgi:uncharacterized protein (DUF305 family)
MEPTRQVMRTIAVAIMLAAGVGLAACAGAPPPAAAPAPAPPVAADVRFMQDMITHHAQALEMAALVEGRTGMPLMERLAERIRQSQVAEIARMARWLEARGQTVPALPGGGHEPHAAHGAGAHAAMPGMASPEQLEALAAASGTAFDRRFLELMIRHHEGALTMVAELFATDSGGLEPELFQLASEVDAGQRAEIARMRQILSTLNQGSR